MFININKALRAERMRLERIQLVHSALIAVLKIPKIIVYLLYLYCFAASSIQTVDRLGLSLLSFVDKTVG
jgi:hypothetical protein